MRRLSELTAREVARIDTVVFDVDDTLLDHGVLTEAAYASLFRLREAGLGLVASTGRPAGFGEIMARQWPIDAAIAENGAVAWIRDEAAGVRCVDRVEAAERAEKRARLSALAASIVARHPEIALADDDWARRTDVALDVGERRMVDPSTVARARDAVHALGVRTFLSSVHLHLTYETFDKASGFATLASALGRDPVLAIARAAFVGDSANDASAFAVFGLTFGVANVRAHVRGLTVPPRYVADRPMGAGFAQVASRVAALRSGSV
jgi:hypothetical protein